MSNCQLFLGDCLDILPTLPDRSVDAIITDLPYGTTACKWDVIIPLEPMWEQVKRVLKKNGVFITTTSQPFTSILVASNMKWFKYEWIWKKSRGGNNLTAKYMPIKLHENVLVFSEGKTIYHPQMTGGKPYKKFLDHIGKENNHKFGIKGVDTTNLGTRFPISVQDIKQDWSRQQQIHPTQKPVALYEYLIRTYTNAGDTVLDFCMGSGTTGVACVKTRRNFIGIEKEPKYYEIARKRVEESQHA